MRFQRTITSCRVFVNAWPMCREPVTFGGGMTIANGGFSESGFAVKYPRDSQTGYQRASTSLGSYALGSTGWLRLLQLGLQAVDLPLDEGLGEVGDDFPCDLADDL